MEAAFGRLHNSGATAFGARPVVMDSIIVEGMGADIALQTTPIPTKAGLSNIPVQGVWN